MPNAAARLAIAEQFAHFVERVGKDVLALQGRASIAHKAPGDLVTEADRLSHELLARELSAHFPGVPLIMEEQDNADHVPARCIVVDELDGTNVYSRGADEFAITVALLEDGRPIAGAMHQPARALTVVAALGGGAFLNGQRIALDRAATLDEHVVIVEINRQLPERGWQQLRALATRTLVTRCLGTAVGSAIDVLRGRAAAYINWRGAKVWDFAAAALAIEEAGGAAVSCSGGALVWDRIAMSALLAANQNVASAAVSLAPSV